MALNRTVEIFLNNARTPGRITLRSLTDTGVGSFTWIEDDKFKVRLRFCSLPATVGGEVTVTRLDADNVIILGGRAVRGAGDLLFSVTDFTEVVIPAVGPIPADYYYEAVLNLNTSPMAMAFGGSQSFQPWVDVEIQAPDALGGDDVDRTTFQFQVTINRQAYDGDEPVAGSDPVYPAPALLATKAYVASAIDAAKITVARTAFVDVSGNDATAVMGNPAKPYLTPAAALTALNALSYGYRRMKLGVGVFSLNLTEELTRTDMQIEGSGYKVTYLTIDGSRAAGSAVNGFNVTCYCSNLYLGVTSEGGSGANSVGDAGSAAHGGDVFVYSDGSAVVDIQSVGGDGGESSGGAGGNGGNGGVVVVQNTLKGYARSFGGVGGPGVAGFGNSGSAGGVTVVNGILDVMQAIAGGGDNPGSDGPILIINSYVGEAYSDFSSEGEIRIINSFYGILSTSGTLYDYAMDGSSTSTASTTSNCRNSFF